MNKKHLIKWIPSNRIAFDLNYDVDNICLENGLIIYVTSEQSPQKIKFHWDSFESFLVTEEGRRETFWHNNHEGIWSFYLMKPSPYMNFIKADSVIFRIEDCYHFCIAGSNLIAEVLSYYEPEVEVIESESI